MKEIVAKVRTAHTKWELKGTLVQGEEMFFILSFVIARVGQTTSPLEDAGVGVVTTILRRISKWC